MSAPPHPAVAELTERLRKLTAYTNRTAVAAGLPSLTVAGTGTPTGTPTCYVVGEQSVGKSSLIAALFRLDPPDQGSHCPVNVSRADADQATVLRLDGDSARLEVGQARELATAALGDRPVLIELGLTNGVPGCVVQDVPGGLRTTGHPAGALVEALSEHDAVILVHDARGPLSATETSLLKAAGNRVGRLAVVLSRTDAAPDHDIIATSTKALLSTEPLLRSAELFTTSAAHAARATALRAENDPRWMAIDRLSGVGGVLEFVNRFGVEAGESLKPAASARRCGAVLAVVADTLTQQLPDQRSSTLDDEVRAVNAALSNEQAARNELRNVSQNLRLVPRRDLDIAMRKVREDFRTELESISAKQLTELADRLQSTLVSVVDELWQGQTALALQGAEILADQCAAAQELALMEELLSHEESTVEFLVSYAAPSQRQRRATRAGGRANLLRSSVFLIPTLIQAVLAPAVTGLPVLLGGALAALTYGHHTGLDSQYRQQLRTWCDQAILDAQRGIQTALDARAQTIAHHLDTRLIEHVVVLRQRKSALEQGPQAQEQIRQQRERIATLRRESEAAVALADLFLRSR